jgi:guanine deaminase
MEKLYASARPCPMCISGIYWARIDRVYFGNSAKDTAALSPELNDAFIDRALSRSWDQRAIPQTRLLAEAAIKVYKEYAARRKRARD